MNVELSNVNEDLPLVSVIVITYNSSKYVLETLDSIKDQTYKNIELIISDDCSPDNTVNMVEDWVKENKDRFISVEVIKALTNTGIAPNCNRGLFASKGEWVKMIAGDDLLFLDAIENLIKYTQSNNACMVLFGRIQYLKNGTLTDDTIPDIFNLDQKAQIIKNLKGSSIKAPSSFLNRSVLLSVGGFDEAYPMIEDVPMWVKLSLYGYRFYFVDVCVTKYRIHDDNISVSFSNSSDFIKMNFYKSQEKMITELIVPALHKEKQWGSVFELMNYVVVMRLIIFFGNRNNLFSKLLNLLIIKSTLKKMVGRITSLRESTVVNN